MQFVTNHTIEIILDYNRLATFLSNKDIRGKEPVTFHSHGGGGGGQYSNYSNYSSILCPQRTMNLDEVKRRRTANRAKKT